MYRTYLTTVYLCLLRTALTAPTQPAPATTPIVIDRTSNVTYVGAAGQGVESFLNIKFGHDTGAENRFALPRAYIYESGSIVNASVPGAACPQQPVPVPGFDVFSNVTNISEDCLSLRIDRPAGTGSDAKLPVMLWIYGGGDTIGQIYDQTYDPAGLVLNAASLGTPIIYAAVNYRLAFFG